VHTHRAEAEQLAALLARYVAQGRSTPGPELANDVEVKLPVLASVHPQSKP